MMLYSMGMSINATVVKQVCEINQTSVNPDTETELCKYFTILKVENVLNLTN